MMQGNAYLVDGLLTQVGDYKQREVRLILHLHSRTLTAWAIVSDLA